jgi:hypothetical protein
MWEPFIYRQYLGECFCGLQEACHRVYTVLIVVGLGIGDELCDLVDQKLGVLLLFTMHQWENNE